VPFSRAVNKHDKIFLAAKEKNSIHSIIRLVGRKKSNEPISRISMLYNSMRAISSKTLSLLQLKRRNPAFA
jgi:hypothetical protein